MKQYIIKVKGLRGDYQKSSQIVPFYPMLTMHVYCIFPLIRWCAKSQLHTKVFIQRDNLLFQLLHLIFAEVILRVKGHQEKEAFSTGTKTSLRWCAKSQLHIKVFVQWDDLFISCWTSSSLRSFWGWKVIRKRKHSLQAQKLPYDSAPSLNSISKSSFSEMIFSFSC